MKPLSTSEALQTSTAGSGQRPSTSCLTVKSDCQEDQVLNVEDVLILGFKIKVHDALFTCFYFKSTGKSPQCCIAYVVEILCTFPNQSLDGEKLKKVVDEVRFGRANLTPLKFNENKQIRAYS